MPGQFNPHVDILPAAQREIWPRLIAAADLGFVLYGGTAVALHLGHRTSIDFDFFKAERLDKDKIATAFEFMGNARIVQEDRDTLVVDVTMPAGHVKISFFGGLTLGRVNDPLLTADKVLLVASLEDLLVTKLKVILDRAEAKDYRDIAAILSAGTSLEKALGAFSRMFKRDAALPLKALGYFKDGDLPSLPKTDQDLLRAARDRVSTVPDVDLLNGLLPARA
jgi:hypothetical protein